MSARAAAVCLALVVLTLGAGRQQYLLREEIAKGDLCERNSQEIVEVQLRVKSGAEQSDLEFSNRTDEQYSTEVLTVDAAGLPTELRRRYSLDRRAWTDSDGVEKQRVSTLEGKTIVIKRTGQKTTVTPSSGKIAKEDEKGMTDELGAWVFFPDRPVREGDEWSADAKLVGLLLGGAQKGTVQCQFQKEVDFEGQRCARIYVVMNAAGRSQGAPGVSSMRLTGHLFQALDLRRMLALQLSGTVKMSGSIKERGRQATIAGTGTIRISVSNRWKKVDGKSVQQSNEAPGGL